MFPAAAAPTLISPTLMSSKSVTGVLFQPLGELLSLVDSVVVLVFESFKSIFKLRKRLNESGHCLRFSGGVL